MLIGIRDAKLQGLLNDHSRLEAKFGAPLAKRIGMRMGLLKAAPRLDLVPQHPPICLSLVDGASETFFVSLDGNQVLVFTARAQIVRKDGVLDLASVTEIEIQGVAQAPAKAASNFKAAQ